MGWFERLTAPRPQRPSQRTSTASPLHPEQDDARPSSSLESTSAKPLPRYPAHGVGETPPYTPALGSPVKAHVQTDAESRARSDAPAPDDGLQLQYEQSHQRQYGQSHQRQCGQVQERHYGQVQERQCGQVQERQYGQGQVQQGQFGQAETAGTQAHDHARTPSILRSLAHHPSLSALRAKTRKRTKAERPPLPILEFSGTTHPAGGGRLSGGAPVSGRGKKISDEVDDEWPNSSDVRPMGLLRRNSRSVPRGLRLSSETDHSSDSPLPHASPTVHFRGSQTQRPIVHTPCQPRGKSLTPEIAYRHYDPSHEGRGLSAGDADSDFHADTNIHTDTDKYTDSHVHMRFNLDYHYRGSHSPRPRGLSVDTGSPGKHGVTNPGGRTRPVSSPSRPIRPATSFSPPRPLLPTSQHPHPVPLSPETAAHLFDGRSIHQSGEPPSPHYDQDDLSPLSTTHAYFAEAGQERVEDGLDLFVSNTALPSGTPGGKYRDLRLGVLSDSAPERGAVRFFSRDLVGLASVSPLSSGSSSTPHSTSGSGSGTGSGSGSPPSPKAGASRVAKRSSSPSSKAAKRSSSPFEIKFSPAVTKRMSLDAFGKTTPVVKDDASVEVLEDFDDHDGEHDADHSDENHDKTPHDETPPSEGSVDGEHDKSPASQGSADVEHDQSPSSEGSVGVEHDKSSAIEGPADVEMDNAFKRRTLSTIEEGSSAHECETRSYTPAAQQRGHEDEAILSSPFVPPRHLSAPPTAVVHALLKLEAGHSTELQQRARMSRKLEEEVKKDMAQASIGRVELERMKIEIQREERREVTRVHAEMAVLEDQVKALQQEIATANVTHETSVVQLHQAINDNEKVFDGLKVSHDKLHARCTDLEAERDELVAERQRDAVTLGSCQDIRRSLESELEPFRAISQTPKEYVAKITDLEERIGQLAAECKSQQTTVHNLRAQSSEKAAEIIRLESQLKATSDAGEAYISTLRSQLTTSTSLKGTLEKDLQNALRQLGAKESIIVVLRDKVGKKQFELDEKTVALQMLRGELDKQQLLRDQLEEEVEKRDCRTRELEQEIVEAKEKNEELEQEVLVAEHEKTASEEENHNLRVQLVALETAQEEISNLEARLDDVNADLVEAHQAYDSVVEEVDEARATLDSQHLTIQEQADEISRLSAMLGDGEDALARSADAATRRAQDSERALADLREQVADLETQVSFNRSALQRALTDAEIHKAEALDVRSRLDTYLAEIDRLKLSEASLRSDLEARRHASASAELDHARVAKRVSQLEEDKELLNIALESKQHELVLLERQAGRLPGTVTPRTKERTQKTLTASASASVSASSGANRSGMAASTGKIPSTPMGQTETPVPHRLAKSTSVSALGSDTVSVLVSGSGAGAALKKNHARRESAVSTPTPAPTAATAATPTPTGTAATPKATASAATPTATAATNATGIPAPRARSRTPLGASTRHNRTPEPGREAVKGKERAVVHKSSLPVLVRRPSSALGRMVEDITEEA